MNQSARASADMPCGKHRIPPGPPHWPRRHQAEDDQCHHAISGVDPHPPFWRNKTRQQIDGDQKNQKPMEQADRRSQTCTVSYPLIALNSTSTPMER